MSWSQLNYNQIVEQSKQMIAMTIHSITNDPKSWAISASIGLVTFFVAKFYYKVRQYPSGPFPLPIAGNILSELKCWLFLYVNFQ